MTVVVWIFALAGAVVHLLAADRMEMSRPRGKGLGGALSQSGPSLVALVAAVL
jgi:putative membrane protein